jgi:hypothetical protein
VLGYASCHENVWGSGGTILSFFYHGLRRRREASRYCHFNPSAHCIRTLEGSEPVWTLWSREKFLNLSGIEPQPSLHRLNSPGAKRQDHLCLLRTLNGARNVLNLIINCSYANPVCYGLNVVIMYFFTKEKNNL